MKKILIFSLAYYPSHVSGAEAAIREITDRIDPSDIEFHLITLLFDADAPRNERIGNVSVHRVGFGGNYPSKILFIPLAVLKARSLHRTHRFDALWSMMTYMLLPVVLSKMAGVTVPHILTLQDGDPYEKVFERWRMKPFISLIDRGFRDAAIVQVISHHLGEWPARRGYRGEVVRIGNGANPRDIADSVPQTEVEVVRQNLGKKPNDVFLINTARLVHQKAFDTTIRALPLLPERIRFVVVGGGADEPMLKKLAADIGVADRVIFVGHVDRSKVTAYRKACDIFVGPSRSEGLGNAFLSAMASRLPVIATQSGGLSEFIFDAKRNPDKPTTAWAVDPDRPEQIADAVKDVLEHPEKVKEVTENARRMVEETYDWDKIAKRMRAEVFGHVL